ncbi:Uncharacterised protein [Mycobacteroides abscessus subsp. abscessus]|nr:Uncharacterised protein [Mycobacteroides abscessus subsp. abscessus]
MIRLLPLTTTSDPETPRPLTRCSMICLAWSSCSRVGGVPDSVRAVRVTRVPPWRSIPSFGSGEPPPVKKMSA